MNTKLSSPTAPILARYKEFKQVADDGDGPLSPIDHMVATYKSLRGLIAVVAFTFLALLLAYRYLGDDTLHRYSISAYYHNQGSLFGLVPVRDLFVAMFCGVALMLYAYKGYKWEESRALNFAAIGLLIVASCPMEWTQPYSVATDVGQAMDQFEAEAKFLTGAVPDAEKDQAGKLRDAIGESGKKAQQLTVGLSPDARDSLPKTIRGWAHYAGAFGFFFGIAYVCWFRARDTLVLADPARRRRFEMLYRFTGILMAGVPVVATVLWLWKQPSWVFWIEFGGVFVFALYWSIKSWELHGDLEDKQVCNQLAMVFPHMAEQYLAKHAEASPQTGSALG